MQKPWVPILSPIMVAGHSLGEISALAAIDALDFESALRLISKRASAMQKVCEVENTGMAVVVGLYDVIVKNICDQVDGGKWSLQIIMHYNRW